MKSMTATALARNLSRVLDDMARGGDEIQIERNGRVVCRLTPEPRGMTVEEAFGDLYGTLTPEEGKAWERDIERVREFLDDELRNPWLTS